MAQSDGSDRGNLLFIKWQDTKDVCVLPTFHEGTGNDIMKRKRKVNGKYTELEVNIPPAIKYYNKSMGGVDSSDQSIQTYAVLRKTRKWWKTLFLHFIDLSVVNSYIVNKEIEKIMLPKRPLETCLQDNYSNKVD